MAITPIINPGPNDPGADTLYVTGGKINDNEAYLDEEKINRSGDTMDGQLAGPDPQNPQDYLTKQYFEDNGGGGPSGDYVKRAGDLMYGSLNMYQEDDNLPDPAPGITFSVEDGATVYGAIGKGNLLDDPFEVASFNGRSLQLATNAIVRFLINGSTGWISIKGYNGASANLFIEHETVAKGGIIYNETDNRLELHGLDDANLSFHTNNRKDIDIRATDGLVDIDTAWRCGSVVCLGSDQSLGDVSTLAGFNAKNYGEIVDHHDATPISGSFNLDISNANVFSIIMDGPTTFNLVSTHTSYSFNMIIYGTKDITWPANAHWPDGVEPTLVADQIDMVVCQVVGPRAFFSVVQNFIGIPSTEPLNCTVYPADTSGDSVAFILDSGCISQREDGSYAAYYTFSGVPNGWLAYIRIQNDADESLPLNYIHLIEGNDPINGSTILDSDYSTGAESIIQYYNNTGDETREFSVEFGTLPAGTSNSSIKYTIDISSGA